MASIAALMPRETPKWWPKGGCLQIGYNDEHELKRIRRRLQSLVYGLERLPYWVWDVQLCEWVQLHFDGMLSNFKTRQRHTNPKRAYNDPKRGPVFKYLLVCNVARGQLALLQTCIEHRLSFDEELNGTCYMGELVKRVWEYKVSSSDHSLAFSALSKDWLSKGKRDVDEFEARKMLRISIKADQETPEWKEDMARVPHVEELQREHMAQNPWAQRWDCHVTREVCGFQVGGGEHMAYREFASLEDAQAVGDEKKAEALTRRDVRERDGYLRELENRNCSFKPINREIDPFDPKEDSDAFYERTKQRFLVEVRTQREARQAQRAAAAAAE